MKTQGIEWDNGNWPKCGKHGASQGELDHVLEHATDPAFPTRTRMKNASALLAKFRRVVMCSSSMHTYRTDDDGVFIRPISARYMHESEVKRYGQG